MRLAAPPAPRRGATLGGEHHVRDPNPTERPPERIAGSAHEINHGRGFVLVRGLPVERYDDLTVGMASWGIGQHPGTAVPQNAYGERLGWIPR